MNKSQVIRVKQKEPRTVLNFKEEDIEPSVNFGLIQHNKYSAEQKGMTLIESLDYEQKKKSEQTKVHTGMADQIKKHRGIVNISHLTEKEQEEIKEKELN